MKLSSTQLEAFYAVAKNRSFTKAAQEIHISQSALSQRILNLEIETQTTLFLRDRSGIELTEAAQELLKYCQMSEQFEAQFLGRLKGNSKDLVGVARIAGFSSIMRSIILPSLKSILLEHPQVQLQMVTKELHELLPTLKRGEVDFIILDHKLERDELEVMPLGIERYILVEPKNYRGPEVYLDHDEKDETTKKYLKFIKKPSANIKRHFLDDIYGVIDGVKLGLGRAVVPEHLTYGIKGIDIKNSKTSLEIPLYLHFYKQPFYTHLHEVLIQNLVRECSHLLRPLA